MLKGVTIVHIIRWHLCQLGKLLTQIYMCMSSSLYEHCLNIVALDNEEQCFIHWTIISLCQQFSPFTSFLSFFFSLYIFLFNNFFPSGLYHHQHFLQKIKVKRNVLKYFDTTSHSDRHAHLKIFFATNWARLDAKVSLFLCS